MHKLAELGRYGSPSTTMTDSAGSSSTERQTDHRRFKAALDETGLVVPMVTTNLLGTPCYKDGGFTSTRSVRAPVRAAQGLRNMDLPPNSELKIYVFLGRTGVPEVDFAKDVRAALDRYREGIDLLAQYSIDKSYGMRFAIEPKPNEPRGDIRAPSIGHAPPSSTSLEHADWWDQPRDGPRADGQPQLHARIAQALWSGKLFHIDLTGRRVHATTRTSCSGTGSAAGLPPPSTCWRTARRAAGRRTTVTVPSIQPCAPRTLDGVWESALANMDSI